MIFLYYIPVVVLIGLTLLVFTKCKTKYIFWINYAVIALTFFLIPVLGFEMDFIAFVVFFLGVAVIAPNTSFILIVLLLPLIITYTTIALHKSIFYTKTNSKY